jgi:hypothetical protein
MNSDTYQTALDEETLKYAAEVLKEDNFTRDGTINQIREWLITQPQLHAKTGLI